MELSMLETVAVAVIALLVLGPEELVRQSRRMGALVAKLRTQANNFKIMVESEVNKNVLDPQPRSSSPASPEGESQSHA